MTGSAPSGVRQQPRWVSRGWILSQLEAVAAERAAAPPTASSTDTAIFMPRSCPPIRDGPAARGAGEVGPLDRTARPRVGWPRPMVVPWCRHQHLAWFGRRHHVWRPGTEVVMREVEVLGVGATPAGQCCSRSFKLGETMLLEVP